MRNTISIVFLIAIGFGATQNTKAQLAKTPVTETASVVRRMVDVYVQSIVDADAKIGATVYVKTMGEMFTKRWLKLVGDTNIQVYGNAAVVEFNWDFVATLRANGQTIHTTGRESQVYIDTPEKGWRLVHLHYSGPPIGGPGQGF